METERTKLEERVKEQLRYLVDEKLEFAKSLYSYAMSVNEPDTDKLAILTRICEDYTAIKYDKEIAKSYTVQKEGKAEIQIDTKEDNESRG